MPPYEGSVLTCERAVSVAVRISVLLPLEDSGACGITVGTELDLEEGNGMPIINATVLFGVVVAAVMSAALDTDAAVVVSATVTAAPILV